jgi:outer membrane receptor protein involved in Fe transport
MAWRRSSGLPALFINGDRGFNMGSGLGVNRCNCPLAQDEKQWQVVSNLTKVLGNHTAKFGLDIRRANNLRVPSDSHRAGELSFSENRTIGPNGGGLGLATFLLGDVTSMSRYVSTSTDAREQQWRHFYYLQDTWRASRKLTINAGLRADIYNPQTVNEAGNGGWLDITTGRCKWGVGDIDWRDREEHGQLAASASPIRLTKTVIRPATAGTDTGVSADLQPPDAESARPFHPERRPE